MLKKELDDLILNRVTELKSLNKSRDVKYTRNIKKYYSSRNIDINNIKDLQLAGYWNYNDMEYDTGARPSLNVIKSCVDTLVSKISQSKVRPFFNVVNGNWKDLQAAKQAQQYFDLFFDQENVNKIVSECFRDACIFDTGIVYIDTDKKSIERALPTQVYIRPADKTYSDISRVYYERKNMPVTALPEKMRKEIKRDDLVYVDYGIYWDKDLHKKVYLMNGYIILREDWENKKLPFVWLYYDNPIWGSGSVSIVDVLYSIQMDIDIIMNKIHDAMMLTPGNMVFMPEGSGISAGQYNNRTGNTYTYKPNPNMTSAPISVVSPPIMDPQYSALLTELINRAYELVGISQLSAQSKKPQGLDSGIALATMEDVESERFEVQVTQIIHCYVSISKICIDSFDPSEDILPEKNTRLGIKWGDVIKASKNMVIQYSAADSLSKDPSTKLEQLQKLVQAGIIPQTRVAQFMQLPDLEGGYSLAQAGLDAVNVVINDCLEHEDYDIPDFVPFDLLKEEVLHTQLTLMASGYAKNKEDIDKLTRLFAIVEERLQEYSEANIGATSEIAQDIQNNEAPEAIQTLAGNPQNSQNMPGTEQTEQTMNAEEYQGANPNTEALSDINMQGQTSPWAGDTSRA